MKTIKCILIIVLIIGGLVCNANKASAYSSTTVHPYLIEQIVNLYNYYYDPDITLEQIEWIKKGSIEEDIWPRNWYYHFYDPVHDRGLGPLSAKQWVQSPETQKKYPKGNHTWQKAIEDYDNGHKKEAFISLGYVLHLIEDMGVPAHTREDPHPFFDKGGDPLENWVGKLLADSSFYNIAQVLIDQKIEPSLFNNLDAYFNKIANFSNHNFFSRDTIYETIGIDGKLKPDAKYTGPEIIKEDLENGIRYAYGKISKSSELVRLARVGKDVYGIKVYFLNDSTPELHAEHFSFLSKEIVINGAGAIKLFFDSVIESKQESSNQKEELSVFQKFINTAKESAKFISSIFHGLSRTPIRVVAPLVSSLTSSDDRLILGGPVMEKSLKELVEKEDEEGARSLIPPTWDFASSLSFFEVPSTETDSSIIETNILSQYKEANNIQTLDEYYYQGENQRGDQGEEQEGDSTDGTISDGNQEEQEQQQGDEVIINEIAWMGTNADYNDEWIELYNKADYDVNLSGWVLEAADGSPNIELSGSILSKGYFLLERTDDQVITNITADQVYTGALSNTGENLFLKNRDSNIADQVDCSQGWHAGKNEKYNEEWTRKTMERTYSDVSGADSGNWHTYSGLGFNAVDSNSNSILGTPKEQNSEAVYNDEAGDVEDEGSEEIPEQNGPASPNASLGGPTVVDKHISQDTTWTLAGSPYFVYDNNGNSDELLEVANGITLTIEAGVVINLVNPGLKVYGTIKAKGILNKPITFTVDFSKEPGIWSGIYFTEDSSDSILEYVVVKYAGSRTRPFRSGSSYSPEAVGAAIKVEKTSIIIKNSIIELNLFKGLWLINSPNTIIENLIFQNHLEYDNLSQTQSEWRKNAAVYLDNSNPIIRNSIFQNNLTGIYMINKSEPVIENNQFSNNSYPIWVQDSYPNFSNNQLDNNNWNGIVLRDMELDRDYTLSANSPFINYDYPYNSIIVPNGYTLTIEPGTVIKSYYGTSGIKVDGTLIANGTSSNQIIFTSIYDDEFGGDTNNDGTISKDNAKAGSWGQIVFTPASIDSSLKNIVARYGGSKWMQAPIHRKADYVLDVSGSDLTLVDSTIEDNTSGCQLENSSSQITNTIFRVHQYPGLPFSSFTSTGIRLISSNATIDSSTLLNNSLGLYIDMSSLPTLLNLIFTNNVQDMEDLRPLEEGDSNGVEIIDIFYDGVGENEADEYVEIKNNSDVDVNLEYWTLFDEVNHTYTFLYHNLEPGQSVKVYTNMGTFSYESNQAIWNNTGDTAYLKNRNGDLIDSYSY